MRKVAAKGRVIDVNLVDSVFSLMEGMLPEYALDGRVRQPVGAAIPDRVADQHLSLRGWEMAVHRGQLRPDLRPADGGDRPAGAGGGSGFRDQWAALPKPGAAGYRDRRLDSHAAGEGRGGAPGSGRRAVLAPFRHRRLRQRSAFPGPQGGANHRRSVDWPNPASRAGDPHGRRGARGRRALDRPRVRRAYRSRAVTRFWVCPGDGIAAGTPGLLR